MASPSVATPAASVIVPGSGVVGVTTVVYPENATPAVTIGYWSIRGLQQTLRYVLAYSGTPFADVRYQQGGAPDYSREAWLLVKDKLNLDFPNLPYMTEANSDLVLTQSTTILRHLARKHYLYGRDLKEQARCDLIFDTAYDYKSVLVDTAYSRPSARAEALAHLTSKTVPHYFSQFEKFFSKQELDKQQWVVGETLTVADFFLFEMLDQTAIIVPGSLDGYPRLQKFRAAFIALPAIAKYRASEHFIERPLNNMAGIQ